MTLNDILFYVKFSLLYEQRFQKLFYILTIEPIYRIFLLYHHVTSRDVRKRTVIRRMFRIRERTADLSHTKSCGRCIVGTLTNKATIII